MSPSGGTVTITACIAMTSFDLSVPQMHCLIQRSPKRFKVPQLHIAYITDKNAASVAFLLSCHIDIFQFIFQFRVGC